MTLQTNDNMDRELSIDELDTVAGGDLLGFIAGLFGGAAGLAYSAYEAWSSVGHNTIDSVNANAAHRNR
jgi:hypothetical protein